jgi:hypothetical protein
MPQGLIGQITELTSDVTIQLTSAGSAGPDNFTVQIARWDTGSITTGNTRTVVTGLSRTATSPFNSGSLTVSPYYGITGVTPMDYALVTTSDSSCHTSDVDQILSSALSVYNPSSNGVISEQTSISNNAIIMYDFIGSGNVITNSSYQDIASFTTLPFGNLGYYEDYPLSGFIIEHVSTLDSNGYGIPGYFSQGPLANPIITNDISNGDGQHFRIRATQIPGITALEPGPNVSKYKITWTMSGNFAFFEFWWDANGNA